MREKKRMGTTHLVRYLGEAIPLIFYFKEEIMKLQIVIILMLAFVTLNAQVQLKDLSYFSGLESQDLIGYGLVIGLDGTGDGSSSQMTIQSIKNMMERFGVSVPMNKIRPNNVAAVMVTSVMPPFSKLGSSFDVVVSSIGDAKSLEGGVLLMTPLMGNDQQQYAIAQGPVSIGGFNAEGKNARVRRNYTNVGRVPNGATVKKEVFSQILYNGELLLNLKKADFTTAERVAVAINTYFESKLAAAEDGMSIQVLVPDSVLVRKNLVGFVSTIENLEIIPQQKSRVVINERTGTIVAGGNVQISKIAISHGNLTIKISELDETAIIAPVVFTSTSTSETSVNVEQSRMMVIESSSVQELAKALNTIKVTPRDMISIFQSIKEAGALHAELVIM